MKDKLNSWAAMTALSLLLLLLVSGCVGTSQAAPDVQERGSDPSTDAWAAALQESTLLHFNPTPGEVTVGNVAAIELRLENVDNLYGLEVHLTFDASVVQIEDDDPTRDGVQIALGQMPYPEFIVQNNVDNGDGNVDYAVVQLAPRPPASGNGVVATIHFRGIQVGTSPISFSSAQLASPDGFAIPVTLQAGSIVVTEGQAPTDTPPATSTSEAPTATAVPSSTSEAPTATAVPSPTTEEPTATSMPTATSEGPSATAPPQPTSPPAPTSATSSTATPQPTTAPPVIAGCPMLYVARSGDTAFSIARQFGISLNALAAANGLSSSYYIQIGQLLTIPGVPGPTGTAHVVQAGETLYSIARRYGTRVETLAALNRIPHPWHVRRGQTLLICP